MVVFPNAKINLGLHVIRKRADGFHDIETLFYPIGLCDALEIIPSPDGAFLFTSSGPEIPGDTKDNLCVRAYNILSEIFDLLPVHIHLHKVIPMGAGLGGGSSDGAFAIRMLNKIFNLGLSMEAMRGFTRSLGSDCPFFIDNIPAIGIERGDRLEPVSIYLSGYHIVIVVPKFRVSTTAAYAGVTPHLPAMALKNILNEPVTRWKELLRNDFEPSVFHEFPVIREVKDRLYEAGAIYSSMSGSGSAVYGLFKVRPSLENLFSDCNIFITSNSSLLTTLVLTGS